MTNNYFVGLLMLGSSAAIGQSIAVEATSSAGESFTNANHQVDFTLGELSVETYSAGNFSFSEGLHQGKFSMVTALEDEGQTLAVSVFPNPTIDMLSVDGLGEAVSVQVFDVSGNLMLEAPLNAHQIQMDVSSLKEGAYTIYVRSKENQLFTSKIFKK